MKGMRLFEGTPWDRPVTCDRCGLPETECRCPPPPKTWRPPQEQTARVALEKRSRGKMVTVVQGLAPHESDLAALLTILKTTCGAGGTVKDDTLEIQGDHAQRVGEKLAALGYRVKNR